MRRDRAMQIIGRSFVLVGVAAGVLLLASAAGAFSMGGRSTQCDNCGPADLRLEGTVDPPQAAIGDALTWRLTVDDFNTGPALNVYVDVTLPANVQLTFSSTDRGTGCTSTGTNTLRCYLDWLADTAQFGHVVLVTTVTGTGDHTLTAVTGYSSPSGPVADPTPADNTLALSATTPSPPPPVIVTPIIESPVLLPAPIAGSRVGVGFWVTRSDNGARLTQGTLTGAVSVGGKRLKHTQTFKSGYVYLAFLIPKAAKGKQLNVKVTVAADGQSATRVATFTVTR